MRKHFYIFSLTFFLCSNVVSMDEPCNSRTPTFRLDEVTTTDSGAIIPGELQDLMLALEEVTLNHNLREKVTVFLESLRQLVQQGYHEIELDNLRSQRTRHQNLRKHCGKLIDIFKKLDSKEYEKILNELIYLYGRLLARENFFYRLAGIPHRIGKVLQTNDQLIFPEPGGYQEEDAYKEWNPGYWTTGCLDSLIAFAKKEMSSPITPENIFTFYTWSDHKIYDIRTTKRDNTELSTSERILKTKCRLQKASSSRLSTGALRIIFDTNGQAYSPREVLSEENKICRNVYFKVGQPPIYRYVYPLKNLEDEEVFIYNVNAKGELYVKDGRLSKHVNILKGEPLMAAGVLRFKDGKISLLNNDSGHYKPQLKHVVNACRLLKRNYGAAIFHQDFVLQNYTPEHGMQIADKSLCLE